ncbi:putative integral membrane protein [Bradyrhizobium sp. GM24.11]
MRKFLTALIVIPLALILVTFAVANRHDVTVSFDPFMANDPALSRTMPLFLLLILVAALGVIAGRLRRLVRPAALAARRAPA